MQILILLYIDGNLFVLTDVEFNPKLGAISYFISERLQHLQLCLRCILNFENNFKIKIYWHPANYLPNPRLSCEMLIANISLLNTTVTRMDWFKSESINSF